MLAEGTNAAIGRTTSTTTNLPVGPSGATVTPGGATSVQTGSGETVIIPPPSAAKSTPEQVIPAGMIDFRNADLNQVLTMYGEYVNRTILRPANLGTPNAIFLKTQTDLTRREAIQALEAVLAINGVAMVNIGDKFVKAVPLNQASQSGGEFSTAPANALPNLGSYVTHVVQLKNVLPSEIAPTLQPFASAIPNPILPIDSSQILVLRDSVENVKRMLEMIDKIDIAVPSEYVSEVIPIKYAKATEIASALNSLSSGGGATSVGASTSTGTSMRGTPRSVGMGGMGSMGGMGGMGTGAYGRSGYGNTGFGTSPFGTTTPGATGTMGAGAGSSFTDRLRNIINRASTSGEINVLGQTKMIADERTNSLLIFASREDMKMIKDVVAKLDIVLAQVLIEAVIVEVSLGNDKDVGFSYTQAPKSSGNWSGVGAINNTQGFNSVSDFVSGSSNALSGGFSYLASYNNDFDVLIKAVAQKNKARIIQRPRIQTSHNEPASLFVGESRPYPTGSYYGGGSYGGYSSIQQLPIGVTLTVTPLINPDGLVVMEISQDIQSANGFVNIANVGDVPITSQKSAQAKVSVRDRDTIILGGLIETSKSRTRSGVPILSDIPVLGFFFSANSTKERRNELIVMIRPTVLPTPEVAALTARSERQNLPLIREAEAEAAAAEARENKRSPMPKAAEPAAAVETVPASRFDEGVKPAE